jgi:hypothetical protein
LTAFERNRHVLREATANAIAELAIQQHQAIGEVAEDLLRLLLESLGDPIPEMFRAISSLIPSTDNAGHLYIQIYTQVTRFFTPQNPSIFLAAVNCVLELVKKAPPVARRNFDSIFSIAQSIVTSSGDELDLFRPVAISIFSNLFFSCPKRAADSLPSFLSYITESLSSSDDSIVYESIRAIGHFVISFEAVISPSIPQILERLLALAYRPLSNGLSDDTARVLSITTAFRISCCLLAHSHTLLPTYLNQILAVASAHISFGDSDCALSVAGGASFLVEAFVRFGLTDETRPLIGQLVSVLGEVVSSETSLADGAGAGLTALSDIVASFGVDGYGAIGDAIERIFGYNWFCFSRGNALSRWQIVL